MNKICWFFLLGVLGVTPALAQAPLQIEGAAYLGVPLTDTLAQAFCCTTAASFVSYRPNDANYVAGFSAGYVLRDRIRVTVGAMYTPVSFVARGTTCCPISNPETT